MIDHTRDTYIAVFSSINRPGDSRTEILITVIPLELNQEMLFWHTSFWRYILRGISYYKGCVDSVCSVIGRPGDNIEREGFLSEIVLEINRGTFVLVDIVL